MSGHLIFNFFQTLGLPIFNTNPNNGCPKRIYQHSGQAHKHFSHRFHGVSFLADVQTWRSKQKFVFIATNPPHYQTFVPKAPKKSQVCVQWHCKIALITFTPLTEDVRPWHFVQPWHYCPHFTLLYWVKTSKCTLLTKSMLWGKVCQTWGLCQKQWRSMRSW